MRKTKMMRVPIDVKMRLKALKQSENLGTFSESFRKMKFYADIGEQIVKRDLLSANVVWFNTKMSPKKKRLFKKR